MNKDFAGFGINNQDIWYLFCIFINTTIMLNLKQTILRPSLQRGEPMIHNSNHSKNQNIENQRDALFLRRRSERRKVKSKGLTYISIVGWICRREGCRRKEDQAGCFLG